MLSSKSCMPTLTSNALTRTLTLCSKDFHRSAKNSWLPVFNSASLEISSKEMNVGADRLASILAKAAQECRELNIWRQFGHMTMDVVGSAAFGWAAPPAHLSPVTGIRNLQDCNTVWLFLCPSGDLIKPDGTFPAEH